MCGGDIVHGPPAGEQARDNKVTCYGSLVSLGGIHPFCEKNRQARCTSDESLQSSVSTRRSLAQAKCKAFQIPNSKANGPQPECPVEADIDLPGDLKDQVLVFKYKGKFHAVDHQCPHSSFPLSQGSLFDIEDFGVVLSAGITCPKHGWSFDLFSGQSDRGNYKLKVWEVQQRDLPASADGASETTDKEVWVRRKQRIG
ncbi:Rieske (2Fe-2S) protein [Aspergillus thermomutatus]|uniref:Rieske domain-containing protein n=1 Tax=Aspergillus thermomutatus TaxID=41047 RepID=A0A397GZE9_ASPTH|nr:uncharacterized protein CDV56_107831 [Aspergillus thermomutatus]RHZ55769.1 hypothetical protein CDV56_107831 [Aspergillus thermomutatus]